MPKLGLCGKEREEMCLACTPAFWCCDGHRTMRGFFGPGSSARTAVYPEMHGTQKSRFLAHDTCSQQENTWSEIWTQLLSTSGWVGGWLVAVWSCSPTSWTLWLTCGSAESNTPSFYPHLPFHSHFLKCPVVPLCLLSHVSGS